eukprot:scaffold50751_cov39-Cyclotella_meneghiniana.AAC.1
MFWPISIRELHAYIQPYPPSSAKTTLESPLGRIVSHGIPCGKTALVSCPVLCQSDAKVLSPWHWA